MAKAELNEARAGSERACSTGACEALSAGLRDREVPQPPLVNLVRIKDNYGESIGAAGYFQNTGKRADDEAQISTRARRQEAIADLGQLALAGLDISAVTDRAVGIVVRDLEVEYGEVLKLLPEGKRLLLQAGVGWKKGSVGRVKVNAGANSHGGYTLLAEKPIVVEDVRKETRFHCSSLLREHRVVSGLSVIIFGRTRPYGVLGAHTRKHRTFTQDDINFVQAIANVLAQAIERKRAEEKLIFQAQLFTNVHDAILGLDEHFSLTYWNPAAEAIYGWQAAEVLGRPARRVVRPLFPHLSRNETARRLTEIGHLEAEVIQRRKDGAPVHIEARLMALRDASGRLTGYISVNRDITRRKRAEEERWSLANIVEFSDDAIIGRGLDGMIVSWNRGAERMFGYQAHEALGRPFSILIPFERLPEGEEIQARIRQGKRVEHYETVRVKKDGSHVPVSLTNSPIKDPAGRITGISTIARDLTKRKQLEAEIVEINETVQQQVGQDLHDGLSQQLRGVAYLAHVLQQNLADQSLPWSKDAARITQLLREAIVETRNLARGLSPVRLDADGLMSGLRELASNTRSIYGISCEFVCPRPILVNQSGTAIHLYRIAQEGIQNAIEHGQARRVIISLTAKNTKVELAVRDDGKGLPKHLEQRRGMGLKIMDYRARTIGAVLTVRPATGGGTLLACSLRIESHKPAEPTLCASSNHCRKPKSPTARSKGRRRP